MAAKQPVMSGDGGFASQVAGMSTNQLYKIMSQMKELIELNQQQARQILIGNPPLTKSLFQAQIMLGMVRPPKVMPNIQQTLSQQPQSSAQTSQKEHVPAAQAMHVDYGIQGESSSSQMQLPIKQQFQTHASLPPSAFQSQAMPSSSLPSLQQVQGALNPQMPPNSLAPTSQIHNLPPPPPAAALQQPPFQSHAPIPSSQMHHSMQPSGSMHQPLQPPLPVHPRPTQPFSHQLHSQVGHNLSFQPPSTAPQLLSQPVFHPGTGLASSFPLGQQPIPVQPPQQLYQGNTQVRADYSGQNVRPMQVDRVPQWAAGPPDNAMPGAQLPGPHAPAMAPGQASQPSNSQLTPELEKSLLQQLMSLTPEQINILPPEQRQQVFHLQQLFR